MGSLPDEFDIIVCGGGSCGCVVAGRFVHWFLLSMLEFLRLTALQAGELGP